MQAPAKSARRWLFELIATDLPIVFELYPEQSQLLIEAIVQSWRINVRGTIDGVEVYQRTIYERPIEWSDRPITEWKYSVALEDKQLVCKLMAEELT